MQKRPPNNGWRFGLIATFLTLIAGCKLNAPPEVHLFNTITLNYLATFYWEVSDVDNNTLTCTIDFGDGDQSRIPGCNWIRHASHRYKTQGTYYATLRVSDGSSRSERTLTVEVPNTPTGACPNPRPQTTGFDVTPKIAPQGVAFDTDAAVVPGKLIIRAPNADLQALFSKLTKLNIGAQSLPISGWALVNVPKGYEKDFAEKLVAEGLAGYAQPVYRYRITATQTPNDPLFTNQSTQFEQMSFLEGWREIENFEICRPIAAIVDSGVDFNHEDLSLYLLPGYDFSDDDIDASFDPDLRENVRVHGTMVTGIIAAITNNHTGIAGTTKNHAYVLPLKIFGRSDSETIAKAIVFAADAGAHLINMSLCIEDNSSGHCAETTDQYIEEALAYASGQGLIALAASGNFGDSYVGYPASSIYTISVGSVNQRSERSNYPSWGSNYGDRLDFVAPGENVYSTAPEDRYLVGYGTSLATPHISGLLALYLGQHYAAKGTLPSFSQAYTCLANNTNQSTWNKETGYGVPQADQVLDPTDGTCYP